MANTNAKKIINNTNGKEVWKIVNNANNKIAFMKKCSITVTIGDPSITFVSAAQYKIDNGNWESINFVNGSQVITYNYDQTLYIRASSYNTDDLKWHYTQHNFNGSNSITFTNANNGDTLNLYQTREKIVYTSTITAGDYVSTVRAKVNDGSWTNADSSVSVQHNYDDTITWEAVTYDDTYESGTTKYVYSGDTSGSFTNSTGSSVTVNRTQSIQYYAEISGTRCTSNLSTGWHNAGSTIIWTADSDCAFEIDNGVVTTKTSTISSGGTYSKSANWVNVKNNGTNCYPNITGWQPYGATITWTAYSPYCFDNNNSTTTTTSAVAGYNSCAANNILRYVLTIDVTHGEWGTYSVTRTSSPYAGASIGTLANGSTIYYGDKLSGSSTPNNNNYGAWNVDSVTAPSVTSTGAATSGNITATNNFNFYVEMYYNTTNSTSGATYFGNPSAGSSVTKTGLSFGTTYYVFARYQRIRYEYSYSKASYNYKGTSGVIGDVSASFEFSQSTVGGEAEYIWSSGVAHTTANINTYTLNISVQNPSYASSYSVSRTSSPYGASTGVLSDGATLYYGDVLLCSATAKSQETTWDVDSLNPPIISSTKKISSSYYTTYIENNDATNGLTLYRNTNGGSGGTAVWVIDDENPYETISVSNCSYGTTYYYNVGGDISGMIYTYSVSTGWSTKTVDSNVTATINYSISTQSTSKTIYSSNVSKSLSYVPTKDDFYIECSTEYDDGADENYYLNYLYIKNNFPSSVTIRHSVNGSADLTSSSNSYSSGQTRSFTSHWTEDTINTVTLAVTYSGSTYTFTYTGSDLHFYWR